MKSRYFCTTLKQSYASFSAWLYKREGVRCLNTLTGNMNRVMVRKVDGEDTLNITFRYQLQNGKEKTCILNRLQSEKLGVSLARANSKLVTKKKPKKKKLGTEENSVLKNEENNDESPILSLYHNEEKLGDDVPNLEAWIDGAVMRMGELPFAVHINLPSVLKLQLPSNIMVGFPVFPQCEVEFTGDLNPTFVWYKEKMNDKSDCVSVETPSGSQGKQNNKRLATLEWIEVHSGPVYIPKAEDIGCHIRVACTPCRQNIVGETMYSESTCLVGAGPGICPFENRHLYTNKLTDPGSFRVVTYNILANLYADSDYSRDVLFSYCPSYALAIDYRKQLYIKELLGYNADIVCLQEMDSKIFENEIQSVFGREGFECQIKLKRGQPEGCATLFRKSKFSFVACHDIELMDHLQTSDGLKDLYSKVCSNAQLQEKVLSRSTILQVTVLKSEENPGKYVVVATTHLYFHPKAGNVRLIQMATCLSHIEHIINMYTKQEQKPSLILCGDLNSEPQYGIYKLLTEGHVPSTHSDWFSGGLEEHIKDIELHQPFCLESAYGTPKFTNYVGGFTGCLDYIFLDPHQLKTTQIVPLPSAEEVTQYTALPNVVFPSDHLALVCDITWKIQEQENSC